MQDNDLDEDIFSEKVTQFSKKSVIELLRKVENKEVNVNELIRKFEINDYKVRVYKNRSVKEIDVDDIYYITVIDGITRIFTKDDCYNSYISLNEWEKRIDDIKNDEFYRSHRYYIVNITKIVGIEDYVIFDNGERALISVRKRKGIETILHLK